MLKLATLCLCFILVVSQPAFETYNADKMQEKSSLEERIPKMIEELKITLEQQMKKAIDTINRRTLIAQNDLSNFPEQCLRDKNIDIDFQRRTTISKLSNCNRRQILKYMFNLTVEVAKFAIDVALDGSAIATSFVQCLGNSNPIDIVICFFNAMIKFPSEVKELFHDTENLVNDLVYVIPKIVKDIESCLENSSNGYNLFLNRTLKRAKMCSKNINL
ncbi:uncharacterized protein LOC124361912 [Homalodisca vitripennis]|uniref:uncharacterized protein LOC124361912 n=1 Tax=Homalodisca vitripennis TaxID=197043 RepID=UPI001EEC6E78|nr:uncharacterized protein LOC124361912 [Homalodisca vitripennis]